MADILHQITIHAKPADVYQAITTQQGLASWWTPDVDTTPAEGDYAIFGFNNHAIVFRMRIEKLVPDRLVRWACEGDVEEWTGTRLQFEIRPVENDQVVLKFAHKNWRSTAGAYPHCNTDWGRLMYYLKDALEGRGTGPMMR